jgi:hypothetical protein
MKRAITRRCALKKVATGTAGAAVAASVSEHLSRAAEEFRVGSERQRYEAPERHVAREFGPSPTGSLMRQTTWESGL